MLSRIYPDPKTPAARAASQKHIRGFINNYPELAQTFRTEGSVIYRGTTAHALRLGDDSRLHRIAVAFGARIALGLYYAETGNVVPLNWWIVARWHTNLQLDQDEHLNDLLSKFGAPRTLRMGKHAVPHEFRYWAGTATDAPDQFLCFAGFRESFGITAIVRPPLEGYEDSSAVYRPGFLKGFQA